MPKYKLTIVEKGGAGSGHFGHSGRPGKRGGSVSGNRVGTAKAVREFSKGGKFEGVEFYHGTHKSRVTKIQREGLKPSTESSSENIGMRYFGTGVSLALDTKTAARYPDNADKQNRAIIKAYVNVKNPYRLEGRGIKALRWWEKVLNDLGGKVVFSGNTFNLKLPDGSFAPDEPPTETVVKLIKSKGYDSILFNPMSNREAYLGGGRTLQVFDPSNVMIVKE